MHRIDTPDAVDDKFNDNPGVQSPTTRVPAAWLNDIQENVCRLILAFGASLTKGDFDQLTDIFAGVGLPAAAELDNLNTLTRSGLFVTDAAATGRPAGAGAGWLVSLHDGDLAGAQIWLAATGAGGLQTRTLVAGDWGAWSGGGWATGSNEHGFWEINPAGVVRQWGMVSGSFSEGGYTLTLPMAFPNAIEDFSANAMNPTPAISQFTLVEPDYTGGTSSVLLFINRAAGDSPNISGFYWRATGR